MKFCKYHALGNDYNVIEPGGRLDIIVSNDFSVTMAVPVVKIAESEI